MQTVDETQTFVQQFHDAGFGVIRHAIRAADAYDLRARLRELLPDQTAGPSVPLQRIVPRIVERDERFLALATRTPLVAILRDIFGVVPQLVCSYGHEKPARTRAHTGPHSDVAHLPGVPHHASLLMVKAMYALTPVPPGAGGTLVFPGSHTAPPGDRLREPDGHHVVLAPGDLLLFHANVRHTATENSSPNARLSVWFMFALPWMRVLQGHEYGEEFLRGVRERVAQEPHLRSIFGLDDPYATPNA